jgi:hypothetical protein
MASLKFVQVSVGCASGPPKPYYESSNLSTCARSIMKPFNKVAKDLGAISSPKIRSIMSRLSEHGECQVKLASGEVFSIHLGDEGDIDDNSLTFKDASGNVWVLFEDQIEGFWTHLGTKE